MGLARRDDAATSAFTFMIAGVVFVASVGSVVYFTATYPVDSDAAERAVLQGRANALVDMVSQAPGIGDASDLERFGLASPGGGLDPARLNDLCGASVQPVQGNGKYSYDEIAASLGITDERFLLRIQPATSVDVFDKEIRVAYIQALLPQVDFEQSLYDNVVVGGSYDAAEAYDRLYNDIFTGNIPDDSDYITTFDGMAQTSALQERSALQNMKVSFNPNPNLESQHMPDEAITIQEEVVDPLTGEVLIPLIQVSVRTTMLDNGFDPSGDVFPDRSVVLEDTFRTNLDDYNVVIVGTGVDHTALTPPVREALTDWVKGGGKLQTLGGWSDWAPWMDELKANATAVHGASVQVDSDHTVFKTPHTIDAAKYVDQDAPPVTFDDQGTTKVWGGDSFDHVLVGYSDEHTDPALRSFLSLSRCGAFGDGFVSFSSYQAVEGATSAGTVLEEARSAGGGGDKSPNPLDHVEQLYLQEFQASYQVDSDKCQGFVQMQGCVVVEPYSSAPGEYFLINMMEYAFTRHLHLEIGERMPQDESVVHAQRLTWIDDPDYGQIPMQVEVYVTAS